MDQRGEADKDTAGQWTARVRDAALRVAREDDVLLERLRRESGED